VGAFGEKLRKQREQQGIALDAISNTTKISTRMLRALEDEHFDQLPGGVFNKGFVRAYARQVGLNEEEAVADYLVALRESQIQAHAILPDFRDRNHDLPAREPSGHDLPRHDLPKIDPPKNDLSRNDFRRRGAPTVDLPRDDGNHHSLKADARRQGRRSEDRQSKGFVPDGAIHPASPEPPAHENDPALQIPWGKLAVGLLLVTFALAIWNSRRHREPVAASIASPAPVPVATPVSTAIQASHSTVPQKAGKPVPAATAASLTAGVSKIPPVSPALLPSLNAASPAESASKPTVNPSPASPAQRTASAAASPASTFTLLIRAEENSWVSITADGKPVAQETLIAPAHTSVRASGEVVVKAGNAAGISFQLNGKDIPVQGNEGEVKTYVFDANGFRILPQTQSPTVR
jgi:Helix-turn-helix domain/Domain of unknown function (DUF4115)